MENENKSKYYFFGSKLNTALLLALIILMVIALVWMYENQEFYKQNLGVKSEYQLPGVALDQENNKNTSVTKLVGWSEGENNDSQSQKSGIIGKVIDSSSGGAQQVDEFGNPVNPPNREKPFSNFEFKIINDETSAITTGTTDSNGDFKVTLSSGSYTLKKSDKYGGALIGGEYKVVVKQNQFSKIDMRFGYMYP